MKKGIEPVVELCRHIDGRVWVRVDGYLKFEDFATIQNGLVLHSNGRPIMGIDERLPILLVEPMAKILYRKFGATIARTGELLMRANVLVFTHPQFVKPWSVEMQASANLLDLVSRLQRV